MWRARRLPIALGAGILAFYVVVYPIHGYRVSIGSDTSVYVWWARLAGASGMGTLQTGSRPAIVGLLATLSTVTGQQAAGVAGALAAVLAASLALAAAAFVESSLGRDRLRFALAAAMVGAFLSLLADGYLSTLAFGAAFLASMACFARSVDGPAPKGTVGGAGLDRARRLAWRPPAAGAALVAAAGLSHPLFLALGAGVLGGGLLGLVPAYRRERAGGAPWWRSAPARIAGAAAAGAALMAAGLVASGAGGGPRVDTSRDSILRGTGLGGLLRGSYLRKLRHDFPWFRVAAVAVPALTPLWLRRTAGHLEGHSPVDADRARFLWGAMLAWLAVAAGGVVLLLAGTAAPGQRLAAFCIPLPVLGAVGLAGLWRRARGDSGMRGPEARTRSSGRGAMAFVVAATVLFVGLAWARWLGESPLVPPEVLSEARTAGAALARTPADTPLVVVMDDGSDKPSLFVVRDANYLRDAVPGARVGHVYFFVGSPADFLAGRPTLTGQLEHDRLARDAWAAIRSFAAPPGGTGPVPRPLVVAVRSFDPAGYAAALAMPGSRPLGPGVVALPGHGVARVAGASGGAPPPTAPGLADPGAGPQSPWLVVWLAPVLLLGLGVAGWPLARLALPGRSEETFVATALAPAFGLGAVGLASVAADALGLRLSASGGWAAAGVVLAAAWALRAMDGRGARSPRRRTPAP